MSGDQLKDIVSGQDYVVLVVTPEIINNYFKVSASASISHFTLLIFDESHHAIKDHPYSRVISKCLQARAEGNAASTRLPQVSAIVLNIVIFHGQVQPCVQGSQ